MVNQIRKNKVYSVLNLINNKVKALKKFSITEPFVLENGGQLPEVTIAYQTYGQLSAKKDNVIWICHALTANAEAEDWWPGLVGPGKLFDPAKFFIVCANMLGSCYGSTGPTMINPDTGKIYGPDFPMVTIRDMVRCYQYLQQHLGIKRILLGAGGSMGGQQLLEWAILDPDLFEQLCLLATNAQHSPWGIAFNASQRMALEADHSWGHYELNAGEKGLEAARSIAMLSYRNYETFLRTQSETSSEKLDQYRASSYQRYQGAKLRKRFNAYAYHILTKAMDSHHLGRKRNSIQEALGKIRSKTIVIGIQSDVLFPIQEQELLAKYIPNASLTIIDSPYGHDGFLVEFEKIAYAIQTFLANRAFSMNDIYLKDEGYSTDHVPGSEPF